MGRICVKYHKSFPYRKYLAEVPLLYFQTDIEQVSCIGFGQFIGSCIKVGGQYAVASGCLGSIDLDGILGVLTAEDEREGHWLINGECHRSRCLQFQTFRIGRTVDRGCSLAVRIAADNGKRAVRRTSLDRECTFYVA